MKAPKTTEQIAIYCDEVMVSLSFKLLKTKYLGSRGFVIPV